MTGGQIIGTCLVVAGLLDGFASWFVSQRIADEARRRIVATSLVVSAAAMVGLGVAFLAGALG